MEQIKELFAYSPGLNSVNDINADFSVDILAKMGFVWKEIDEDYIERFLNATKKALFGELI